MFCMVCIAKFPEQVPALEKIWGFEVLAVRDDETPNRAACDACEDRRTMGVKSSDCIGYPGRVVSNIHPRIF